MLPEKSIFHRFAGNRIVRGKDRNMKFENIAKALTICSGVCMTIAGIFDVISGSRMEKACECEEGAEGEEAGGACACGKKTVRGGVFKIFFGGILSGVGVASLFVDFEEKLRDYNPELADKLSAYEELAQQQWDEKSALGREKLIEGRDRFVPYAQQKFVQGREKVVPFAKEQWTRGNEKFGELRSAAYDKWASYRAREDELAE